MTRRAVGTLIVASWAVCMVWLVVRQTSGPDEAFLEAASVRLAPGGSFFQVSVNGLPIGNAGITLDTTLTGYRLTEIWSIDEAGSGKPRRHVLRSNAGLSHSFKLLEQAVSLSENGVGRMVVLEQVDGQLTIRQSKSGVRAEAIERISAEGATIPGALPFRLMLERRLEAGNALTQPIASPFSGRLTDVRLRVHQSAQMPVSDSAVWDSTRSEWLPVAVGQQTVWEVDRSWSGMPMKEWIDRGGHLVRRNWAFGLTLERSPFEINYNVYQAALREGKIRLPRMAGDRQRAYLRGSPDTSVREIRVVVARTDGPAWTGAAAAFAGARQSVVHDTVTISRESTSDQPPAAGDYLGVADPSDALAKALAEALSSPLAAGDTVSALLSWVTNAVRTGNEESPAEPSSAARARRASPEGKVRLLVELARMAGYPARAVIGVDLGQDGLPAHTWAEIWRGDRWVSADPWYGHLPASAMLLRTAEGANARPLAILPLVAALKTTTLTTLR